MSRRRRLEFAKPWWETHHTSVKCTVRDGLNWNDVRPGQMVDMCYPTAEEPFGTAMVLGSVVLDIEESLTDVPALIALLDLHHRRLDLPQLIAELNDHYPDGWGPHVTVLLFRVTHCKVLS